MPVHIKIKPGNLNKVKTAFLKSPETVAPFILQGSTKSAQLVERKAKERSPVHDGRLRSSIGTSFGIGKMKLGAMVSTNVNYAVYVHEGTKPHFPPPSALEKWAADHGMSPWAVAIAISRKGTKAQPFMRDAVEESKNEIEDIYELYIARALDAVKTQAT